MKGGIIILENLNKPVSEIPKTVVKDKSTQKKECTGPYSNAKRAERPQKTAKVDDYRNISSIKRNPFKKSLSDIRPGAELGWQRLQSGSTGQL